MGKYLKMADVFVGEYRPAIRRDSVTAHRYGEPYVELYGIPAKYASNAINSHDELVEEVERLRRQLACAFMAGWEEGINGMECDEAEVASIEIAEQFARN